MTSGRGADGERNRIADAASVVAQLGFAAILFWRSGLQASFVNVGYLVLALLVSLGLSICLHELGHLVAGELVSWRWRVFKAGPVLLLRDADKFRLKLGRDVRYRGIGLVVNEPASDAVDVPARRAVMLLGGPCASLGLAALGLFARSELAGAPYPSLAAGVFAAASGVILITTVLPFRSSGHLSDGGKVLALLQGRAHD
jgi:hypothetical protein